MLFVVFGKLMVLVDLTEPNRFPGERFRFEGIFRDVDVDDVLLLFCK